MTHENVFDILIHVAKKSRKLDNVVENVHFFKKWKKNKKGIDTQKIIWYINTTLREKTFFSNKNNLNYDK